MIIIFGYRTPAATEVPAVLYIGDDGVEANRICETDAHPRIARLDQPIPRPYKHWTEEASAAFEKKQGKKLEEPKVANVHPHLEPGANVGWSTTRDAEAAIAEAPIETATDGDAPVELSPIALLEEMTIDDLKAMADDEGIDVSAAKLKRDYAEIIALYRELDEAHKAEEIKALAADNEVDPAGLKTKRDFLNALVAARRGYS